MSTVVGVHHEIDPPRDWEDPCDGRVRVVDQTDELWALKCDKCRCEWGRPARMVDPAAKARMRMRQAGFPSRFVGKHFGEDPQNADALRTLTRWLRGPELLPAPALTGNPGAGKTHLLVALGERLIRQRDVMVLFRSIARLLDELQEAFDRPGAERSLLWHRALSADVVLLDDLGAERQTDWRTDRLARLVDERWENERPVVIATNVPPGLWGDAFDARTASRLRGMTFPVELKGADRRVQAIKQEEIR